MNVITGYKQRWGNDQVSFEEYVRTSARARTHTGRTWRSDGAGGLETDSGCFKNNVSWKSVMQTLRFRSSVQRNLFEKYQLSILLLFY